MSRLEHETTTIFPSGLSTFIYYSLLKQSQTWPGQTYNAQK